MTVRLTLKRLWLFRIILGAGILVGLATVIKIGFQPQLPDYIQYWSASRLNLQGANPYDPLKMLAVQVHEGWQEPDPILMWNPPWILPLLIPFGLSGFRTSQAIWLLLEVCIIIFCASVLWSFYGGKVRRAWQSWLIAFCFAPTIFSLLFMQISPFLLFGLTIFLLLITGPASNWKTDLLAGAATWLLAFKPQYLYLFWVVLLFWSLKNRRWFVLFGAGGSLVLAVAVAMFFNPAIIGQYLAAILNQPPDYWATPTFGYWLRIAFGVEKFSLQFIPGILGLTAIFLYWLMRKHEWDWKQDLPWIVFGSVFTSPYGWSFDQVVLLPFLIQALISITQIKLSWLTWLSAISWLSLNVVNVILHFRFGDENFVWFAPLVLIFWWILYVGQKDKKYAGSSDRLSDPFNPKNPPAER